VRDRAGLRRGRVDPDPGSCCGVLGFKAHAGASRTAPFVPGIGLGTTGRSPARRRRRRPTSTSSRVRVGRILPTAAAGAALRTRSAVSRSGPFARAVTTASPTDGE
jgi:hypothetical protein